MGPEATATFYSELIRLFQIRYGAKYDSDYPEIIIFNLPLPDVVMSVKSRNKIALALKYGLKKLEKAGADFIVAPCNTICAYYTETRNCVRIPVYSIIKETVRIALKSGAKAVGILGTQLTIKSRLYDDALKQYGVKVIKPTEDEALQTMRIILNILKGKKRTEDVRTLLAIIRRMQNYGADGIILGCTELPLLLKKSDSKIILFDTLKILADFTIKKATMNGQQKLFKPTDGGRRL